MTEAAGPAGSPDWLLLDWYPAGQWLLRQGERSSRLYVLRAGEVAVERDGLLIQSVGQPGSVFGEMALLLETSHSATVRAVTDIEVFVIADALRVLEANPAWALQVARLLARRLAVTTGRLAAPDKDGAGPLVLPRDLLAQWGDPQV